MALLRILTFPDPRLREKALEVKVFDEALKQLAADMVETMYAAPGVGLAATQVGVVLRMVVVDEHAGREGSTGPEVYVNPQLIDGSGEIVCEEGCLSLPDFSEDVKRKDKIHVRYQDLDGKVQEITLEGFHAVILQHEMDHLEGVLAVDRVSRLKRALYSKRRSRASRNSKEDDVANP